MATGEGFQTKRAVREINPSRLFFMAKSLALSTREIRLDQAPVSRRKMTVASGGRVANSE